MSRDTRHERFKAGTAAVVIVLVTLLFLARQWTALAVLGVTAAWLLLTWLAWWGTRVAARRRLRKQRERHERTARDLREIAERPVRRDHHPTAEQRWNGAHDLPEPRSGDTDRDPR